MPSFIELTQGFITLVDDEDYDNLNNYNWYYSHGYATRMSKEPNRKIIHMHRVIKNTPPGMETDHINNNGLDNRKCNLRICTRIENIHNSKIRKDNTSGYRGVTFHKATNKWMSRVQNLKNRIILGYFDTAKEAALEYDKKAKEFHGEFAKLNFPRCEV